MISLYARAIYSKDKKSLLKVAEDANAFYLNSFRKRYLYYIKNFQALIYTHHTFQECWLIASNINGRTFKVSKFSTAFGFFSLPFTTIYQSKEIAFSNLLHFFFSNIYPVSDISTNFVKNILQVPDQYVETSTSILLSFLEVMNIRIFSSKNKKINIIEILFQTLVTAYALNSVSVNFDTIERIIPNKILQYIIKRFQVTFVSSFINLLCSIGFSNGMRISFERWLFSLFKLFKTHFHQQIQKVSLELNNDDINNISEEYGNEETNCYDIRLNIPNINDLNNFIQINRVHNQINDNQTKNIVEKEGNNSNMLINIVNNGKKQHLLRLDNLQEMSTTDLITNAYHYKVNTVIPPKALQCSICHHLLHKPVESYGYFFCKSCIQKYIQHHENKDIKHVYAKNPITGHFITQRSLNDSPFMNYIIYRYKHFLLDDCVEEYRVQQTKKLTTQ